MEDKGALEAMCRILQSEPLEKCVNGIALVEIDDYRAVRAQLGLEGVERLMEKLGEALRGFAGEETHVFRLTDMTYAVALHRLSSRAALREACRAIQRGVKLFSFDGLRRSISASSTPPCSQRRQAASASGTQSTSAQSGRAHTSSSS